jgi:hypothetical protein
MCQLLRRCKTSMSVFIGPNTLAGLHAFLRVFQVQKLGLSCMELSRIFMASSHLTELGPIIAYLHVVGSSLSNNKWSVLKSNYLIVTRLTRFNRNLDLCDHNLWGTGAMHIVAASGTLPSAALLSTYSLGSTT